ncbi:MAG: DNA replication/repair protein RecF [Pseudomonadota bacterium]
MAASAFFSRIKLSGYRNYRSLDLPLDRRHVVLTGPNGSGKTNLIEAVSLFSPGRGLRRAVSADLIYKHMTDDGFSVFAELNSGGDVFQVGTGLQPQANVDDGARTRRVRINGTFAKTSDELLDLCRIIWLTPAMDGLFTGSGSDRRRFLDRMVLAIDPGHGQRANAFERALRQRNRLIDDTRSGLHDNPWLDSIEAQLVSLGVAMHLARAELVALLSAIIEQEAEGEFPSAVLTLAGEMEALADACKSGEAAALEGAYAERLKAMRPKDQAARRTLIGPHRSDLMVRHRQKDMEASLCSTGEQKALLVGLVLSHCALTSSVSGHAPIMLFDEIAAHLDADRRAALFDKIDTIGGQAFMTGTDRNLFDALGDRGQRFRVDAGSVTDDC